MTEHDIGLKVGTRALLWNMGFSTRIDVEMRGSRVSTSAKKTSPEPFTDLDVLGIRIDRTFGLSKIIADCKTGTRDKPTARMFWTRGVADFFSADQAMLIRENPVPESTKQLSDKLGISILSAHDLLDMQRIHSPSGDEVKPNILAMFDAQTVLDIKNKVTTVSKRLKSLEEYRQFDFWLYSPYRNVFQLPAHLKQAQETLDSRNPLHLYIFLDLVWLYITTLAGACSYIQGAFMNNLDRGLQEYIFGGPVSLMEKLQTAESLIKLSPDPLQANPHLPDYYSQLSELIFRIMRRPRVSQAMLRHAEVAQSIPLSGQFKTVRSALADNFDPLAAKLTADVAGFMVSSAGLDNGFREACRTLLTENLTEPPSSPQPQVEVARPAENFIQKQIF